MSGIIINITCKWKKIKQAQRENVEINSFKKSAEESKDFKEKGLEDTKESKGPYF